MLLNEAQDINAVALYPWLMFPVVPVIIVVLAFNFFGDGPARRRRPLPHRLTSWGKFPLPRRFAPTGVHAWS